MLKLKNLCLKSKTIAQHPDATSSTTKCSGWCSSVV